MQQRSTADGSLVISCTPQRGVHMPEGYVSKVGVFAPTLGHHATNALVTIGEKTILCKNVTTRAAKVLIWNFESRDAREARDMTKATLISGVIDLAGLYQNTMKSHGHAFQDAETKKWLNDLEVVRKLQA